MKNYIKDYNEGRLHSAIGYVTPMDRLTGLDAAIQSERKVKLLASRMNREKLFREPEAKRSEAPTPSSFIGAQSIDKVEVYENEFAVARELAETGCLITTIISNY